jgi:hypothetical protein
MKNIISRKKEIEGGKKGVSRESVTPASIVKDYIKTIKQSKPN